MSATFGTVDFGFRPIRPEEDYSGMECGEEDPPHGSSLAHPHASGATFRVAEDEADDLFISDTETLPDSTGFGARQRLINEQQRVAAAAAERAAPGPFLGSTLTELCESYGAIAAASSTPCDVWAEVITTLREREAAKRAWVLDPKTARHMKYRTTLIEWVLEVCADFGFGPTTADLAVQYMDRVLSKVNVPKTSLQLVAMCCLEVAVKYEEIEADVPSLPKLRRCASNVYSVEIIKKMELAVLIELDWDLASVATAHFLEAVLALTGGGTFPHDDIGDRQWTNACCVQLRKLCGFLHSICLQDGHVGARAGEPSRLAAAIVATARLQLGVYPVWPAELRAATGYACDTLGPAMSSIMKLYKDSLPPSGIGSGGGVEKEGGGVEETNAFFETDDKAYERADGPGGYESGSGSLGSAATREVSVMSADGVFQGDLDAVRSGKYADDEGRREFLTPSPTGPLDAGMFFDEAPFSTEAPAA